MVLHEVEDFQTGEISDLRWENSSERVVLQEHGVWEHAFGERARNGLYFLVGLLVLGPC